MYNRRRVAYYYRYMVRPIAYKSCSENIRSVFSPFSFQFGCFLLFRSFFFAPRAKTNHFHYEPRTNEQCVSNSGRINLAHNKIKADYYFYLCTAGVQNAISTGDAFFPPLSLFCHGIRGVASTPAHNYTHINTHDKALLWLYEHMRCEKFVITYILA